MAEPIDFSDEQQELIAREQRRIVEPGYRETLESPPAGLVLSADDELLAECRAMVNQLDPPPTLRTPTAREVTVFVDETAKAEMRRQGRDPEAWDRLPAEVQDQLRLLALDRLRRLS